MEIGTSSGAGTNVICRAMGLRRLFGSSEKRVFSIDVPPGANPAMLYPDKEDGHPRKAGRKCKYRWAPRGWATRSGVPAEALPKGTCPVQ
jgi:hypothetical protein